MVYQLRRPVDQQALRDGAVALPVLDLPVVALAPESLPVWGAPEPPLLVLDGRRRTVTLALHNAGAVDCQVVEAQVDGRRPADWLRVGPLPDVLPGDGRAVPLELTLRPAARPEPLSAGLHQTRLVVRCTGGPLEQHTLVADLTLQVPDAPVPWFGAETLTFAGEWPRRRVRIAGAAAVQVGYGGRWLTEPRDAHELALYPGEYDLGGPAGAAVTVQVEDGPPRTLTLPARLPVATPARTVELRNVGPRPLHGRLVPQVPWLAVQPELVDLAPGAAVRVTVICQDDGRWWAERTGRVALRAQFGTEELGELTVVREFHVAGPQPVLLTPMVEFPRVCAGGSSVAAIRLQNAGDAVLQIGGMGQAGSTIIAPGGAAALPVSVGPPLTLHPGVVEGVLPLHAPDAVLPYWQQMAVPYRLEVVAARLLTTEVDFGEVKYEQVRHAAIRVERSDRRLSRLAVDLPPELADVLRLSGDLLFFRNLELRPLAVDAEFPVRDLDLDGTVIGRVRVQGRSLVPMLTVWPLKPLRLVPGESRRVPVHLEDAGGGLQLTQVAADVPWLRVEQEGLQVTLQIDSARTDRGRQTATLLFHSNDYQEPVQRHPLTVAFAPTFWMRVGDLFRPIRRLLQPLRKLLTPRR